MTHMNIVLITEHLITQLSLLHIAQRLHLKCTHIYSTYTVHINAPTNTHKLTDTQTRLYSTYRVQNAYIPSSVGDIYKSVVWASLEMNPFLYHPPYRPTTYNPIQHH